MYVIVYFLIKSHDYGKIVYELMNPSHNHPKYVMPSVNMTPHQKIRLDLHEVGVVYHFQEPLTIVTLVLKEELKPRLLIYCQKS
jgi:hypothetical protein